MKLPLISIPTVYHVGTLDPNNRGVQFERSYEGAWLSASLCPDAWAQIAHLGGNPTWALCNPKAYYLDVHRLSRGTKDEAMQWASERGLVQKTRVFTTSYYDSDAGTQRYSMYATRLEAEMEQENIEDVGDLARVAEEDIWTLTPEGRARAKQGDFLWHADDFALQFWVEDVLSQEFPQVFGLYWDETYDPLSLSAPRIAISPLGVEALSREKVDESYLDSDDTLLEMRAPAIWLEPDNFTSPYRFVTNCVSADGDAISAMTDDPACRDLEYGEFVAMLGPDANDLLDDCYPEYASAGSLSLANDRCVTFHASSFEGADCLFVVHSAIEYVFQREDLRRAPRVLPDPEVTPRNRERIS